MNEDCDSPGDDDSVGYEQARRLRATLDESGIDRGRLWLYYFSLGGNISDFEVDAYLHHSLSLPRIERDLLALAANELLAEMVPPQAPYAEDIQDQRSVSADDSHTKDQEAPEPDCDARDGGDPSASD